MKFYYYHLFLSLIIATVITFLIPHASAQEQKTYTIYVDPIPSFSQSYASNVMEDAITAWHNANPNVNFVLTNTPSQYNFEVQWIKDNTGGPWSGEALLANHIMLVTLGDSVCGGAWHPYTRATLDKIAEHELGHLLGLGHSTDPNNVMNPNGNYFQYGLRQHAQSLPSGGVFYIPLCNNDEPATFSYSLQTTDNVFGVNFYFTSQDQVSNYGSSSFRYYNANGCYYGQSVASYAGSCSGLAKNSYMIVSAPPAVVNSYQTVTVNLAETTPPLSFYIPTLPIAEQPSQTAPQEPDKITSMTTDKSTYTYGDWIIISGQTNFYYPNSYIKIIVNDQRGNTVASTQALNNIDKTFSAQIHAIGNGLTNSGFIQIIATYGNTELDSNPISFIPNPVYVQPQNTPQTSNGISINTNQIVLTSERHLAVMTITGLVSDNLNGFVKITIKNQDGQVIEDRDVSPASDNTFRQKIVITNNFYPSGMYDVSATQGNNYLGSISFQVINQITTPEFGPLTGMIIAISIIGVLTISRKVRFHF